jgi:predicted PurR-regulated permease PerM
VREIRPAGPNLLVIATVVGAAQRVAVTLDRIGWPEIVGTLSKKKVTIAVLEDIAGHIERFLVIQLLTSGVVALVTWAALSAMGLQQAALWGLLAGILNVIPYYGPLLVTAGLSVVGYMQFGTIAKTAAVAGVSLLITTLEGSLLTPMWIGRVSSMNHVAVFAGLLFWSWIWGIWECSSPCR